MANHDDQTFPIPGHCDMCARPVGGGKGTRCMTCFRAMGRYSPSQIINQMQFEDDPFKGLDEQDAVDGEGSEEKSFQEQDMTNTRLDSMPCPYCSGTGTRALGPENCPIHHWQGERTDPSCHHCNDLTTCPYCGGCGIQSVESPAPAGAGAGDNPGKEQVAPSTLEILRTTGYRACMIDLADLTVVKLYQVHVWVHPGGTWRAIMAVPVGEMVGPQALPAVLDQLGYKTEWKPSITAGKLPLLGPEIPEEHRKAVAEHMFAEC